MDNTTPIRSALFVPAGSADKIPKAYRSEADTFIIDLEDAVAHDSKHSGRQNLLNFAEQNPAAKFWVRINGEKSIWFEEDLSLVGQLKGVQAVLLSKTESKKQVNKVAHIDVPVVALIETARGVNNLADICTGEKLMALSFGGLDLAYDLGINIDSKGGRKVLDNIRTQILLHSHQARLQAPIEGVYPAYEDTKGYAKRLQISKDMGFGSALCIHPKQVDVVHRVFGVSEHELALSRRIVDHVRRYGDDVFQLDNKMVDAPVIQRAREILRSAGE